MDYKGYAGRAEFDDEMRLFSVEVLDLRDVITFRSTSAEGLEREFRDSVDDYLEFCEERGEQPNVPPNINKMM